MYSEKFNRLNMNRQRGRVSPHKVCMLLAVMDLIAHKTVRDNRIFFDDELKKGFSLYFNIHRTENDRDNPHLPFFHLKSERFWHHHPKPGHAADYQRLTTVSGPGELNKHIAYAFLDEPLFQLFQNQVAREYLKASLLENLNDDLQRALLNLGNAWDWLECEAIVADYFVMMELELKGKSYNKTHFRKVLLPKLNNRTDGAIEFKHQNISAILIELGYPYIAGYKPAFNYQQQLKEVVLMRLAAGRQDFEKNIDAFVEEELPPVGNVVWEDVLDSAPKKSLLPTEPETRAFTPRYYNFAEREVGNRRLGEQGEEFVFNYEKNRLSHANRDDLAKEITWTSREKGDGAGYDIHSFNPENEEDLFIEVKTSTGGKYQPFYISENEVAFSKINSPQYSLYRVFNYKKSPKLFILPGDIRLNVHLTAYNYKAIF
ncbi:MAG: DUF3883 domain-containing protein [Proteobacteria bacterium]|nr:DUF3883 domain-containing protein [Pseudomonadota bacterium]MBU1059890.1 DUF3883 domain-containing protein [Pseudomonadota bacterium]